MSAKTVSEQTPETQNANGLVDLAILDDDLDFCNYLEDALKMMAFTLFEPSHIQRAFSRPVNSGCRTSSCST